MKGVFVINKIVKQEFDAVGREIYCEYSDGLWIKREYGDLCNETYYEDSDGLWIKWEYDDHGNETYYESSTGFWEKREYDDRGYRTYYENSTGYKEGTPRAELENPTHDTKYILNGEEYTADELRIGYRITTGLNNDAELTDDEIYSYMLEQFELDERDIEMGE